MRDLRDRLCPAGLKLASSSVQPKQDERTNTFKNYAETRCGQGR